jgi:hypothetical protein
MNKKRIYSYKLFAFLISLTSAPLFASSDIPTGIEDAIDPPPPSPIDGYLIIAIIIGVVSIGYYFYKSNKSLMNNEK